MYQICRIAYAKHACLVIFDGNRFPGKILYIKNPKIQVFKTVHGRNTKI